jgi:hypothetical protein
MRRVRLAACALAAVLGWAGTASAVALNQVDDFEDGTTRGWSSGTGGSPNPPANVPDGGPQGAGDAFLRVRGSGQPLAAGGKPTVFNTAQWAGNYSAAGVSRISADVRNTGPTQVDLRLQLTSTLGTHFVTAPVMVPSGSNWVRATWSVAAANLIPADAVPGDPAQTLANVAELRVFHGPDPTVSTEAPAILAEYGLDNIRAEAAVADRDGDGVPDASDNCPFLANPAQTDTNANRRGNACECGDQNGDGRVDVLDLVAINVAIFNPSLRTPLCDANNDDNCSVNDIVAANLEIFSPGSTSTCAAQPVPGP